MRARQDDRDKPDATRNIRALQILYGTGETQFPWHQDNTNYDEVAKEKIIDIEFTVIYNLTMTKTAMQVAGKEKYEYKKHAGVVFLSELWHRSAGAETGTIKVTVFVGKAGTSRSPVVKVPPSKKKRKRRR